MLTIAFAPDLSSLAANAAVELDLLINGESTGLEFVKELGERLQELLQVDESHGVKHLQADTTFETILGQAFTEVDGADPTTILSELFSRTQKVADALNSAESRTVHGSLEWHRAFCVALSQSASAYRQLMASSRPPHPFRR